MSSKDEDEKVYLTKPYLALECFDIFIFILLNLNIQLSPLFQHKIVVKKYIC